jgi:hypothetical protein
VKSKFLVLFLLLAAAAWSQQALTNGMSAQQSAAWTSASAAGASGVSLVQPMAVTEPFVTSGGYTTALVSYSSSGTITGGVVSFEVTTATDGNSGWQATSCYRVGATPSSDTTYTLTGSNQIWQCPAAGVLFFRVRLSTAITGSGTASLTVQATTAPAAASNAYIPVDQPQLNTPLNVQPQALITRTYLGFGSANTAKTTGAIAITSSTTGHNIVAIGCSGNFATSSWAAAVTDSASNTYFQIGANSGTYPQANSTTQVCIPFIAVNAAAATTITFTISGASSANTTVSVMAWDVANAIPSLATVDGWSGNGLSSVTAISTSIVLPSQANELAITGGCMSTGTITLATNSALTFDSGSQTIASGSNIASCFGGSAVLGQPAGVTGSFTDGSSASGSVVAVLFRGYNLTDSGQEHLTGSMLNATASGGGATGYFSAAPAIVSNPPGWCKSVAAATTVAASVQVLGVVGKAHVVTSFGYAMMGDATGAAAQETFTLTDGSSGNAISMYCSELAGVDQPGCSFASGPIMFPVTAGASVTAAFGAAVGHALESVYMCGFDVSVPNVVY